MPLLLGLLIFSFIISSLLLVPFIDLLYTLRFQRQKQKTIDALGKRTPIFDRLHKDKAGTPIGGGLLVIGIVSLLFAFIFPLIRFFGINISTCFGPDFGVGCGTIFSGTNLFHPSDGGYLPIIT